MQKLAKHRCERCGAGLLHELVRCRVESPDGVWAALCAGCTTAVLDRLAHAHVEAGAQLESLWLIGESAA
jgi:hypothetical protein